MITWLVLEVLFVLVLEPRVHYCVHKDVPLDHITVTLYLKEVADCTKEKVLIKAFFPHKFRRGGGLIKSATLRWHHHMD